MLLILSKLMSWEVAYDKLLNWPVLVTFFTWCVLEAGVLVKSYVDRGILVPDDIMTRLMLPRLEQLSAHSWLLDGETHNSFLFIHVCICQRCFVVATFATPVLKRYRGVCVTWCPPLLKCDWLAQVLPPNHQSWVAAPDCGTDVANWQFSD